MVLFLIRTVKYTSVCTAADVCTTTYIYISSDSPPDSIREEDNAGGEMSNEVEVRPRVTPAAADVMTDLTGYPTDDLQLQKFSFSDVQ